MAAKNIKNAQKHLLSFLCILRFFAAAIQSLVLLLVHIGCEKPQQLQNTKRKHRLSRKSKPPSHLNFTLRLRAKWRGWKNS
jgi:hypothetical protein